MYICRYTDISMYIRQNLNVQHTCQCTNTRNSIAAAKQNQNDCQKKITILKFAPVVPRQDPTLVRLWVLDNSEHALWQKLSFLYASVSTRKMHLCVRSGCQFWYTWFVRTWNENALCLLCPVTPVNAPISAVTKIKPREITNDFQTFTWIEKSISLILHCSFLDVFSWTTWKE